MTLKKVFFFSVHLFSLYLSVIYLGRLFFEILYHIVLILQPTFFIRIIKVDFKLTCLYLSIWYYYGFKKII